MVTFMHFELIDACPYPNPDIAITMLDSGLEIAWQWFSDDRQLMRYAHIFSHSELKYCKCSGAVMLEGCTDAMLKPAIS